MAIKNVHSGIKFRILSIIKSVIPMRILFYIRYLGQFFHSKSLSLTSNKIRIYYLDAPDYRNLGDQAIALAIRNYVKSELPEYEFIEILQCEVVSYMRWVKNIIKPNDIIFLTGGGNLGNKYRMYEATRRFVIKALPKNKIFIFPQSVDFTDDVFGRVSMKSSCKLYNLPNVQLFIREKISLSKVGKQIPRAILVPDIVLSMKVTDSMGKTQHRSNIGICLRNDMESVLKRDDQEFVFSFGKTKAPNDVIELSTTSDVARITDSNREDIISQRLSDFSKCKLIITDRLHAMIFSVITKTPCVVFDNKNHKISGTYEFIKEGSAVVLINTIEQLDAAVEKVLTMSYDNDAAQMYDIISKLVKRL